jgi:protein-tyrosine phosphatase
MIDLHSHILPGVDDGSPDMETTLAMARMAVDDGIQIMACTPHFMPGLYHNNAADIKQRVLALNEILITHNIDLPMVAGGDIHIRPDFIECLRKKTVLCLHDSRYVLFEPPHVMMPLRLEELLLNIQGAGYVPIVTHPERLAWIEQHYPAIERMVEAGAWMQVTSGSLTGRFGRRPQYWAQRMLQDGLVHVMASDAHNLGSRPPKMAKAFDIAAQELGVEEARNLVLARPHAVLTNMPVERVVLLPAGHKHAGKPQRTPLKFFAGVTR